MLLDVRGAYILGGGEGEKAISNVVATNNVAAGSVYAGFIAPGVACGETGTMQEGNLAHSIDGEGWVTYANGMDKDAQSCFESSGFTSYKTTGAGVLSVIKTDKIIMKDIVVLDAGKGLLANHGGMSGASLHTLLENCKLYGEIAESHDCPTENWCDDISWDWSGEMDGDAAKQQKFAERACFDKVGTIAPLHLEMGKSPIATTKIMVPLENPDGDGTFAGHVTYKNVEFHNFGSKYTYCGNALQAVKLNKDAADIIPLVTFEDCLFDDVDDEAFVWMFTPPDSWITVRACGSFPCTGPLNTAFSFENTVFTGEHRPWKANNEDF